MERRHLEYFLAIADVGSFTRAAARLNVAQPSLSQAIRSLERELDTDLFERLGRGVRLTPAGEALLEPARRTVRSFALASGAVRGVAAAGFGTLTIVTNTLWAVEPLVQLIGEFRQLHPAVQFEVTDPAQRAEVVELVRSGEAELGLIEGTPPSGRLESLWLADHEFVAVLPARSMSRVSSVTIADLAPMGLISTPPGTALRVFLDRQLESEGLPMDVAVETAHVASVVPLVLARAGVTVLPEGMAAEAAAKGARVVRLTPPRTESVSLVWRADRLGEVGEHFVAMVRDLFRDRHA